MLNASMDCLNLLAIPNNFFSVFACIQNFSEPSSQANYNRFPGSHTHAHGGQNPHSLGSSGSHSGSALEVRGSVLLLFGQKSYHRDQGWFNREFCFCAQMVTQW
ncbi:hypothetical protein GOODEAATRI_026777 [Goodea atripinnis]|uniref:Uncharacterized protein n=1 Tax=Goodea atripinnis TaxID=208336 RepID=A0ABV0MW66_9TELE